MSKNRKLKIVMIITFMIIVSLFNSVNCLAYQDDEEKTSYEPISNIIEANLETREIKEKIYDEVINSTTNLVTAYNQITHTEPYYPSNEVSPHVIIGGKSE